MNCTIKNPANHDLGDLETHTHEMYDFFATKYGFKKPPTMVFDSDPSNQSNILGKTAYYDPQSLEIHIFVDGRHPKDILRSIAHELIHHRQNLEDRLDVGGYNGPGYYLENEELKDIEHEAMLEGNATMREYEDTKKYKENKDMSLNEWKNNELNQLLMKKFGILKENKTSEYDDDPKLKGGQKDLPDGLQKAIINSTNEELDESHCGSHKRDDDVSEGKGCEKCKSSDCECEGKEMNEGDGFPVTATGNEFLPREVLAKYYGLSSEEYQTISSHRLLNLDREHLKALVKMLRAMVQDDKKLVRAPDGEEYPINFTPSMQSLHSKATELALKTDPKRPLPPRNEEVVEENQLDEYSYEQEYADRDNYRGPRGKPTPIPEPKELSYSEKRAKAQKERGQRTMDKASIPRQFRENKAQELKEAINKIANAKRIFLKNKRIK